MFHLIKPNTKIDFVGKRHFFTGLSILALLGSFGLLGTKGLNYGIDFTGGAEIQVRIPTDWNITKLRSEVIAAGVKGPKIQQLGESGENEYLIRAQGDGDSLNQVSGQIENLLAKNFSKDQYEILRADVVGPAAGALLRKQGFLAMFYALLAILIYVGFRFDSRYAPGTVLALFHDTLIVLGVFSFSQMQFDLSILAALLALVGYSNNDTIIVYDRVRETTHLHPNMKIEEAVNLAINETLGRTIVTSVTTFFVVSALYVWGGQVIQNFAFTLMSGVIVGTYSSIFVASSIIIWITRYYERREKRASNQPKRKRREYKVAPEPK